MKPYMIMAVEYCYKIKIYEPNTRWKFKGKLQLNVFVYWSWIAIRFYGFAV